MSGVKIFDNNVYHESTSTVYNDIHDYFNYDARASYVFRNDTNYSNWYAAQPSWGQTSRELVQVEIIPYNYQTPEQKVRLPVEVELVKYVANLDEEFNSENSSKPGSELIYKVIVTNKAAEVANLQLSDTFPDDYLILLSAGSGSNIGDKITWNVNKMKTNETKEFVYSAKIKSVLAAGEHRIENRAVVISGDKILGESVTFTAVSAYPKIEIQKRAINLTNNDYNGTQVKADPGDTIQYIIKYRNIGNALASKLEIVDKLSRYLSETDLEIISSASLSDEIKLDSSKGFFLRKWNIDSLPVSTTWQEITYQIKTQTEIDYYLNEDLFIPQSNYLVNHVKISSLDFPDVGSSESTSNVLINPQQKPAENNIIKNSSSSSNKKIKINKNLASTGNNYYLVLLFSCSSLLSTSIILIFLGTRKLNLKK